MSGPGDGRLPGPAVSASPPGRRAQSSQPDPSRLDSSQPDPSQPDPGGALIVTTVGGAFVATDAVLAHGERVERVAAELRDDRVRAAYADLGASPVSTADLGARIALAERCAADLAERLRLAARIAEVGEESIRATQEELAGMLAASLGGAWPLALLAAASWSPVLAAGALAGWLQFGGDDDAGRRAAAERWLLQHPELVTSPQFVTAVRLFATSADDAGWAAAGIPAPLAAAIGDQRVGLSGVESSAVGIMGFGALFGLLRETPVTAERTGETSGVAPAQGAAERLERVPDGGDIVIERHDAPGVAPRWVVYVGPTETFSPVADGPAFDQTSNTAGVAGQSAGSIRALEQAMADAGVAPTDQVQLVGFSQGGLVAARAAESGQWAVVGLETYGAPTGNVELPEGIAGMAVRHTDDLVPALAGPQLDHRLLQVEREAFAGDAPLPTDLPVPAHQKDSYLRTATVIDAAQSAAVRDQVAAMDAFTAEYASRDGATTTVFSYHAERVEPPPPEPGPRPDGRRDAHVPAPSSG